MKEYKGIPVSTGIAAGTVFFAAAERSVCRTEKTEDTKKETRRLITALNKAAAELTELYRKTLREAGTSAADIFLIHKMMLQDSDFYSRMRTLITEDRLSAETAVGKAAEEFSRELAESGSEYIAERGADVSDVADRIIRILRGKTTAPAPVGTEKIILVANEITPSLTLMFSGQQLLGLVSGKGSATSHTAILARSLGIPAVIVNGVTFDSSVNGQTCIVDGVSGGVYFSPDSQKLRAVRSAEKSSAEKASAEKSSAEKSSEKERELFQILPPPETATQSGKKITLYANAGSLEDVDAAVRCGAEGIGLFRSEFSYLGRTVLPTEAELTAVYQAAAKKLGTRKFIIRTLDIGADKKAACIPMQNEPNPALGIRALRLCFANPQLFTTQLRAVLRAGVTGNVAVMFPMICSLSEIHRAKQFLKAAAADLKNENVPHAERIETGIMIETPAAAVISDVLAAEVDFFSIGTNDLTQYTLAVDRQNADIAEYCDPHHESVLRLIELTAKHAREHGIWCGICGELGADTSLTERFIKAGISELSAAPSALHALRKKIRSLP